jgi:tetratricopeptide (TPR) repeat protein
MNDTIKNFETLLAKGQDNAMIRYSLGNAYLQQKAFPLAIEHFAKALAFDPLYSAAWKGYGKALASNQQIPEAIAAYTQGIVVAEEKGDKQTVKEMTIFLKRLQS